MGTHETASIGLPPRFPLRARRRGKGKLRAKQKKLIRNNAIAEGLKRSATHRRAGWQTRNRPQPYAAARANSICATQFEEFVRGGAQRADTATRDEQGRERGTGRRPTNRETRTKKRARLRDGSAPNTEASPATKSTPATAMWARYLFGPHAVKEYTYLNGSSLLANEVHAWGPPRRAMRRGQSAESCFAPQKMHTQPTARYTPRCPGYHQQRQTS
jgi:hypothetical protein